MANSRVTSFSSVFNDGVSARQQIAQSGATVTISTEGKAYSGSGTATTNSLNIVNNFSTKCSVFAFNKSTTTVLQVQGRINGVTPVVLNIPVGEAVYIPCLDAAFGVYLATAAGSADFFYAVSGT